MDAGHILILAILILGGVIATIGDLIGTRVGKARLSLFSMRPKNTAVMITMLTGILVSASTLGILFAADEGLRKGVFELDDIQRDLRDRREQLDNTAQELEITNQKLNNITLNLETNRNEKKQVKNQLEKTKQELEKINSYLKKALRIQIQTQYKLKQARGEIKSAYKEKSKLLQEIELRTIEKHKLYNQSQAAIAQREQELDKRREAIEQRDYKIIQLDGIIQKRNLEISQREEAILQKEFRLQELEKQRSLLEGEVARLEKYYQSYRDLRLGKLALIRGQVLAAAVVTVEKPSATSQLVIKLLEQANRNANIQLAEPGTTPGNNQIVQINQDQIKQLSQKIRDGKQYVVRVLSAGNYVRGEDQIEFFADAALNQLVFSEGEILAVTTTDPKTMTSYQLRQRLELLISASQFRARNAGILESIEVDSTFLQFMAQINKQKQAIEIRAVAAQNTYTAGPLKVKLIAMYDGKLIFST
ncbi:Myosin heavy chain, clone 203 [Richelia intracellularis HM01]|uniref:DUF3084 domain-containing protein n=1 Tax=Richelia intracellularis TaxID=1164990 RepID=UPI0002B5EDB0|nr:DUF3084 domain-containing protein [Richelia intracellularis]CCH65430.1 Myosin heavy chain, clone 203 [Richelia intracellularis HM01]